MLVMPAKAGIHGAAGTAMRVAHPFDPAMDPRLRACESILDDCSCVLRDGRIRGLLSMRFSFMPQRFVLILRSAPQGRVSKDATLPMQFLHRLFRGGDDGNAGNEATISSLRPFTRLPWSRWAHILLVVMTMIMMGIAMKTISASEFETKCLELLDEIAETGETLVITKDGRPVAELRPAKKRPRTLFGAHKGLMEIKGDIISPIGAEWEALKE